MRSGIIFFCGIIFSLTSCTCDQGFVTFISPNEIDISTLHDGGIYTENLLKYIDSESYSAIYDTIYICKGSSATIVWGAEGIDEFRLLPFNIVLNGALGSYEFYPLHTMNVEMIPIGSCANSKKINIQVVDFQQKITINGYWDDNFEYIVVNVPKEQFDDSIKTNEVVPDFDAPEICITNYGSEQCPIGYFLTGNKSVDEYASITFPLRGIGMGYKFIDTPYQFNGAWLFSTQNGCRIQPINSPFPFTYTIACEWQ